MELQWLPNELILQILSKLPVKSLLRFRSVCKDWFASISDTEFTLSSTQRRTRVIDTVVLDSVDFDEGATSVETLVRPREEGKLHHHQQELRMLGSCNGLLLVSLDTDIFLWNPSTRVSQKVLTYDILKFMDRVEDPLMSGLVYDSTTNDYKVVIAPPFAYKDGEYLVQFCSLKNKCWKDIVLCYKMLLPNYGKPVVNGHCHWIVQDKNSSLVIIYFDPIRNEIRELPIPDRNGYLMHGLGELDGCLAISRRKITIIEVWTMKEYGVEESWSCLFKISISLALNYFYGYYDELEPLCYTKDGQVIMRVSRHKIVVYDPKRELYRSFSITAGGTYVETLISPLDVTNT